MRTIKLQLVILLITPLIVFAQNKYVGVKMCGMCHRGEKKGEQLEFGRKANMQKHLKRYARILPMKLQNQKV